MASVRTKRLLLLLAAFGCLLIGFRFLAPGKTAGAQEGEAVAPGRAQALPDKVDFNFHVKPILSDRCFKCHGPDEKVREGGLALHDKELAFAALGEHRDRHAIIPGDAENSILVQRIYAQDEDDRMPPVESNLALTEYEKALLKSRSKKP